MSMLEMAAGVALLSATQRRGPFYRNSYSPLRMLGAMLCVSAMSEAFDNIGIGLGGAALALGAANAMGATGALAGSGEAAGSASAAAAAAPIVTPRAMPQPSLGLNLSPAAPTMGM
jgi:hypothetical protein